MQQANNFCSAPWIGLYYHSNAASPCCTMQTMNTSPKEYLDSYWLKTLKLEFLKGERPNRCGGCWNKEDQGLTSIRKSFGKHPYDQGQIKHLELRESNLCNFACRMCNPTDSVKIERELEEHPELARFYQKNTNSNMTEENWSQILDISLGLNSLYLTGGEPMLMKRYYDLLDHLIANGKSEDILLRVYTNCSVYNPIFIEKILKFKDVGIKLSIDAVGPVAEYQRYGTQWDVVKANAFKFAELPIKLNIHSTITAYSILDESSLADFFIELKSYPKRKAELMWFNAHVSRIPAGLEYSNLNVDLRARAIQEIDKAVEKLSSSSIFTNHVREIVSLRKQLLERRDCNFDLFVSMTKALDRARNQSFEEVFGYKI